MALPDFGMALQRGGHSGPIERPFSFKGVGRVDENVFTLDARADIDGVDHIANIDLDSTLWKALIATLPAEQGQVVGRAGSGVVGDFVELPFVACAYFTCVLGEPQPGSGETFIPLRALSVAPAERVEISPADLEPPLAIKGSTRVALLQVAETAFGDSSYMAGTITRIVLQWFAESQVEGRRKQKQDWFFFWAVRPHWAGLRFWLGFSPKVPQKLIDAFQALLEEKAGRVEREFTTVTHTRMTPQVHLSDDGLELLYVENAPSAELVRELGTGLAIPVKVRRAVVSAK